MRLLTGRTLECVRLWVWPRFSEEILATVVEWIVKTLWKFLVQWRKQHSISNWASYGWTLSTVAAQHRNLERQIETGKQTQSSYIAKSNGIECSSSVQPKWLNEGLTLPLQTERTQSVTCPVSSLKARHRLNSWSHSLTAPPSLDLSNDGKAK